MATFNTKEEGANKGFFPVKTFTEKPNLEIAKTFLKSGDFLWNSGMFIWKAKTLLRAVVKHLPEVERPFAKGSTTRRQTQRSPIFVGC